MRTTPAVYYWWNLILERSLKKLANRCSNLISLCGLRNHLTFAPKKSFQLLLKGQITAVYKIRIWDSLLKETFHLSKI